MVNINFVKLDITLYANNLQVGEEKLIEFSLFRKVRSNMYNNLMENVKKKYPEVYEKIRYSVFENTELDYLPLYGLINFLHTGEIKYKYDERYPQRNLADLKTRDFLNTIIGYDIDSQEKVIMITDESLTIGYAFISNWQDMVYFCDSVYKYLFDISFVQEEDYIFLFPEKKKIYTYSHDNWCSCIEIL